MKQLLALALVMLALSAHGEGGIFAKEPAFQTDAYGALAYDAKSRAWAYAIKVGEKGRATSIAAKLCGPSCEVHGPFEQCAAVAANDAVVGYGSGPDRLAAETSARDKCGKDCSVAVWGCNQLADAERFGYHRNTHHPKNYGAITYDASTGAYGTVWDQPGFADAVAVVKGNCGKECRIYMAQAGDCGVLAKGDKGIATGSGVDYKAAETMALAKCGGNTCKVVSWFCNSAPQ